MQDALGDGEVVVGLDDERARDAEILLVLSREREALERSAVPSVRWLHAFSTGIDGFPLDVIDGRQFTCSRGANAVPIAEFVLASMLAFVKRLPDTWLIGAAGALELRVARRARGEDRRPRRESARSVPRWRERALAFDMRVVAFRRRSASRTSSPRSNCARRSRICSRSPTMW